jgi:hypothetical protein
VPLQPFNLKRKSYQAYEILPLDESLNPQKFHTPKSRSPSTFRTLTSISTTSLHHIFSPLHSQLSLHLISQLNMATSLPKKTVLLTGCSHGGIGSSLALAFHKHNFTVFATARSLYKISHLKGFSLTVFELDTTDPVSIKNAVEAVKTATGGTLDILINNAGAGTCSLLFFQEKRTKVLMNEMGRIFKSTS